MNQSVEDNSKNLIAFVENLKRQWMATVDALVDPLMIVNKDYIIQKTNQAMGRFAKKDVKSLVGQTCYTVFAGRKSPCPGCLMKQCVEQGKPLQFQLDNVGDDLVFEVNSQPIFNDKNELEGVAQVYRDRTEAVMLQEKLIQSEKLASIGQLAGGFAHEINNPLAGIIVFSQMVLREMPKDSQHYQDVTEIEAAAQRCKGIVENLLDFARKKSKSKKSEKPSVNIVGAVQSALRFAKVSMDKSRINVEENWHTEERLVNGEHNKLIQVFLNLIQNAFQAMPDGGVLTLKSVDVNKKGKEHVQVMVADTGVGIPQDNLSKIFDPFFTTKDPGQGTGLGLAICYGIVQEFGGFMEVKSTINKGTTFSVFLPKFVEKKLKSA